MTEEVWLEVGERFAVTPWSDVTFKDLEKVELRGAVGTVTRTDENVYELVLSEPAVLRFHGHRWLSFRERT